jgi:hypothetical protein
MDQTRHRQFFELLGATTWTTVSDSWYEANAHNGGVYSAFASTSLRDKALAAPEWEITKGDFTPGFSQHNENGEWVTTFESGWGRSGFEPLDCVTILWEVVTQHSGIGSTA